MSAILTSAPNVGNYYGIIVTAKYFLDTNVDLYQKLVDYARLFHVNIVVLYAASPPLLR